METPQRLAAVILTYFPDPGILTKAVASLCPQVDQILIVENGGCWERGVLFDVLDDNDKKKIEFVCLQQNIGVGAGHNHGIRWARTRGFSHVLILDHDSIPRSDMVRHLVGALRTLEAQGIPVSAVGPRYVDRYTGQMAGFVRLGRWRPKRVACDSSQTGQLLETDFIISSGALFPMVVLDRVGEMNEDFFIDHVDTEWMFRASAAGYKPYGVCDAVMEHSLGIQTLDFWLGCRRTVPLHSPERHYYVFRNSVLLRRMRHVPRRWIVNDLVRLATMIIVFALFAPDRIRRISLMGRGIWHGLRGVTGPLR